LFSRSTAERERERFKQIKRQIEEYAKTLPGCCFPVSLVLCLSQKQVQRFDARIFTCKFLGFFCLKINNGDRNSGDDVGFNVTFDPSTIF
jgi:hypothetical protein